MLRHAGLSYWWECQWRRLVSARFNPFWAKAEELGAVVFMHPLGSGVASQIQSRLQGNGFLSNVIGNPLD